MTRNNAGRRAPSPRTPYTETDQRKDSMGTEWGAPKASKGEVKKQAERESARRQEAGKSTPQRRERQAKAQQAVTSVVRRLGRKGK